MLHCFFVLGILFLGTPLQAQTVTLKEDDALPASSVLNLLQQVKRSYVLVDDSIMWDPRKISFSFEHVPFEQVFKELLDTAGLTATEQYGITYLRRTDPESALWRLMKGLYQLKVRFAYDPLKEKIVVGEDLTDAELQRLMQFSGLSLKTQAVGDAFTITILHDTLPSTRVTANFQGTTLDIVAKTLGVTVDPASAKRTVVACLDGVPRQTALGIIARLTKTRLAQRGNDLCFVPIE